MILLLNYTYLYTETVAYSSLLCFMGFYFLKVTFPMVFRTKNIIPHLEDPLSLGVLISTDVEIPGAYIKVSVLNYIPPQRVLMIAGTS